VNWLIIGSCNDLRVKTFQQALSSAGLPSAQVVSYAADWQTILPELLNVNTCLRIEAPYSIEDAPYLIKHGAEALSTEAEALISTEAEALISAKAEALINAKAEGSTLIGLEVCSNRQVDKVEFQNGEFFAPHQFYLGLKRKLELLDELIKHNPVAAMMNCPSDILTFFDKQACHQRLSKESIALPQAFYGVVNYDDLRQRMFENNVKDIFIKTRFGSGASGIVALKTNGSRSNLKVHALTTVEQTSGRLYNTLRLQKSVKETEVASLVDRLCKWGVHCESWIPKAVINRKESDCRLLLVNGEVDFMVLRKSDTPITNLHLLNERAQISELTDLIESDAWKRVLNTCHKVAQTFPKSFQLALDVAVHRNKQDHYVLELNAFGDFLQKIQYNGMNTHQWQIQKMLEKHQNNHGNGS